MWWLSNLSAVKIKTSTQNLGATIADFLCLIVPMARLLDSGEAYTMVFRCKVFCGSIWQPCILK